MAISRDTLEVVDAPLSSSRKRGFSGLTVLISAAMAAIVAVLVMMSLFKGCVNDQVSMATEANFDSVIEFPKKNVDVRLPKNMVPDTYKLRIKTFFWDRNFTFDGSVIYIIKNLFLIKIKSTINYCHTESTEIPLLTHLSLKTTSEIIANLKNNYVNNLIRKTN